MSSDIRPPTCIILGRSPVRLWGIDGAERLRRSLIRTPAEEIHVCPSGDLEGIPLAESVLLLRADFAFENVVVASLVARRDVAVVAPAEGTTAAAHVPAEQAAAAAKALLADDAPVDVPALTPEALCGAYNNQLRKRETPYLLRVTKSSKASVERRMFAGSYKGVTDIVTKFIFPWPSRIVTGWAAELHLKPNHVTFVGLLCTIATCVFWWRGDFAWGLLMAWLMCLLDTVDGKLARVTLTFSKFGDLFDHAIDLVHPPFWYWAWIVGLGASSPAAAPWVLWTIVFVYIAQRLQEAYFIKVFGIEMHIWRPFDSFFRSVTARRDPNLLLLTIAWAIGFPSEGILLIAGWAVVSFAVHGLQILQAHWAKSSGRPIESWLV